MFSRVITRRHGPSPTDKLQTTFTQVSHNHCWNSHERNARESQLRFHKVCIEFEHKSLYILYQPCICVHGCRFIGAKAILPQLVGLSAALAAQIAPGAEVGRHHITRRRPLKGFLILTIVLTICALFNCLLVDHSHRPRCGT